MRVIIVAVNFNSEAALTRMLDSVPSAAPIHIDIVIVDNSNSLPASFSSKRRDKDLRILKPKKNLGYMGGFHYALESDEVHDNTDLVILTNPDIRFDCDFFSRLGCLALRADVAVLAPKVIAKPSNIRQNPFMRQRPSAFWLLIRLFWHSNRFLYRFYEAMSLAKRKLNENKAYPCRGAAIFEDIYAPHGSLLIFSGVFLSDGWLPRYFGFLYGEEIFVAEQVVAANMKARYCPDLVAYHDEHVSTGHMASKLVVRCSRESLWGLYKTYFNPFKVIKFK